MAITLEPGDILSTGTPAGIGLFHSPPVYLKPGDIAELEIDSIGKLVTPLLPTCTQQGISDRTIASLFSLQYIVS